MDDTRVADRHGAEHSVELSGERSKSQPAQALDVHYLEGLKRCPEVKIWYWARVLIFGLTLVVGVGGAARLGERFYQQQQALTTQQREVEGVERAMLALPKRQAELHALQRAWHYRGAPLVLSSDTLGAWLSSQGRDKAPTLTLTVTPVFEAPVFEAPGSDGRVSDEPVVDKRMPDTKTSGYRLVVNGPVQGLSQWLSDLAAQALAIESLNWSRQAQGQWQLTLEVSHLAWPESWLAEFSSAPLTSSITPRASSSHWMKTRTGFASRVLLPAKPRHQCVPDSVSAFANAKLSQLHIQGRSQYQQRDFVWLRDPTSRAIASVSPGQWFARPAHLLTEVLPHAIVTQQGHWAQGRCHWRRQQWPYVD
ncbi:MULTISPECIES: hypothetical protein [unclassified Vibrio]|uniref:Pilus assembly protein n=1 Tax=Vibrio sp. HB236076 TaxID=3232307 RepID=A0AB39HH01_9VIBR|nr:hypothetical protein [Vibrio sp. HB161653]MDP5255764.1 hypothetical protein [Vibrio sp. HB161653]